VLCPCQSSIEMHACSELRFGVGTDPLDEIINVVE
jgi:hypothetical protein